MDYRQEPTLLAGDWQAALRRKNRLIPLLFARKTWYNIGMNNFGTGKSLKEASPQLQDDARRHARILDIAERDSVIEGLPPFSEETREKLRKQLQQIANHQPVTEPAE